MKEKVFKYLKDLEIEFQIYDHPALYTCSDKEKYGLKIDGIKIKNLFLRNKNKKSFYLISMKEDKSVDLKKLALILNETKLSFANEEQLFSKLKITSGTVSLLNVTICEKDVIFIIDQDLISDDKVCFHPNDNTATVTFSGIHIKRILNDCDVKYQFISLSSEKEK